MAKKNTDQSGTVKFKSCGCEVKKTIGAKNVKIRHYTVKIVSVLCLTIVLLSLFPVMAQAQTFTPDIPEGMDYFALFNRPSTSSTVKARVSEGELVHVEDVYQTGWCFVRYKGADGTEHTGYMKIASLIPLDEQATVMAEAFAKERNLENSVIKWGLILLGIAFVGSFLVFLRQFKSIISGAAMLALCALQVYFLTQTSGFSWYLPSAVGWMWAILWSACFVVFLILQCYV